MVEGMVEKAWSPLKYASINAKETKKLMHFRYKE